MNYTVHITATAERDLIQAIDYIEFQLKNPQAADQLLNQTEQTITALSQFPQRHPLVEDKTLASWGIRFIQIGHYLAFYVLSERTKQVTIVRFLYMKSDWSSILKLGFPLV